VCQPRRERCFAKFDEIGDGGATATITIQANGHYTVVITNGSDQETDSGNFEVTDQGVLDTSPGQGEPGVWQMTLNGNTLTGENPSSSFDFDQDGSAEEEADLSVTMQKAS
jgi:flagellar basal body rod protein FlgG